jgi:hypothetical protein
MPSTSQMLTMLHNQVVSSCMISARPQQTGVCHGFGWQKHLMYVSMPSWRMAHYRRHFGFLRTRSATAAGGADRKTGMLKSTRSVPVVLISLISHQRLLFTYAPDCTRIKRRNGVRVSDCELANK